jgi:UDP-glucose 4-epimerase
MSHIADLNKSLVLTTGATGTIGPRVVQTLTQAGFRIRSFSVDTPAAGMFPQSVEVLIGDVTDQAAVQSAMWGVDAVIHMAALLHIVNPPPEMREKYERVNIGGTTTVVEAAIKAGVKRVVLFSTIAVYGPSDGCVLNEMSPTHPDTFYAQTKGAAEQIVLNARGADGRPLGTVLRLGAVYGSRIKGNYKRLTHALARNRFIPIGNGLNRRTLVYDKDVGRATALAVSHPAAAGRVFNVTDGEFHTMNEIIESICSALGRRPPTLTLPVSPVRRLAGIIEDGSRLCGLSSSVVRATVDKYTEDVAVDGRKFCMQIGFVPKYDLAAGWRETVDEMRHSGEI